MTFIIWSAFRGCLETNFHSYRFCSQNGSSPRFISNSDQHAKKEGRKEKWPPNNHGTKPAQGTEAQGLYLRLHKVNANQECLVGSLTPWKSTLVCRIHHHMLICLFIPVGPKMLPDKCCDGGFGWTTQQADVSLAKRPRCSEPGNGLKAFPPLST